MGAPLDGGMGGWGGGGGGRNICTGYVYINFIDKKSHGPTMVSTIILYPNIKQLSESDSVQHPHFPCAR